ncbi:MAG: hypothetical protein V1912_01310 [bacterium]
MVKRTARNSGRSTRRHESVVVLGLTLALVLALVLGAVGCGSDEVTSPTVTVTTSDTVETTTSTTAETATTATSELTTTTDSSSTTTTEALSSAETRLPNGHIRAMGYIDRVWESGGVRHISIDYAEMLTGEEAKAAAVEAGDIAPGEDLPNDYFIRNINSQKREFTVAASASITTATLGGGMDEPVTWAQFKSFWAASPPAGTEHLHIMPWWIERDGYKVVSIAEQYLP